MTGTPMMIAGHNTTGPQNLNEAGPERPGDATQA